MTTSGWDRALIALGALAGLAGVALSAAAAHVTGAGTLETAARFLLFHAPALIALAALSGTRLVHPSLGRASGFALALGLGLFSGDLALRAVQGVPLFPMAAPSGGVILMLGWVLIAVAAARGARRG
jgi:uncharacterized membrane protein YgdD (TMEM256/DUF423 family)